MARSSFEETLGKMRTKASFVKDRGPAVKDVLAKFDPAGVLLEVDGLAASNAAQESLKGTRIRRVDKKATTLGSGVSRGVAAIDVLRGSIKGSEIAKKEKKALLAALPKSGRATTEDAKIGFLQAVLAFIGENPAQSGKVTPEEIARISSAVEEATKARGDVNAAKSALPLATTDLYGGLRTTSARITAWLDILQGIYTLAGDAKSLGEVRRAREELARDTEALAAPAGPATTTG